MKFKDHFSGHAANYAKFRPNYPRQLFEYLVSIAPGRGRAWDCATGNGQAAVGLSAFFECVIGRIVRWPLSTRVGRVVPAV